MTLLMIEAMPDQRVDPAARNISSLVEQLIEMPVSKTRGRAKASVAAPVRADKAAKKARRQLSGKTEQGEEAEAFVRIVARMFEQRYRGVPAGERDAQRFFLVPADPESA